MKRLLILIIFLSAITQAKAATETTVHNACEFAYPASVTLNTPEGTTTLHNNSVWQLSGLIRPNAKGTQIGVVTILDITGRVTGFRLYHYGNVARPYSIACETGVNVRISSSYLDCRLKGVC